MKFFNEEAREALEKWVNSYSYNEPGKAQRYCSGEWLEGYIKETIDNFPRFAGREATDEEIERIEKSARLANETESHCSTGTLALLVYMNIERKAG